MGAGEDELEGGDIVVDDEGAPAGAEEPAEPADDAKVDGDAVKGAVGIDAKVDPIDLLLDPNKRPVWAKELLLRAEEADADLGVSEDELNAMPIEAQRVVANLLRRAEQAQAALQTAEQKIATDRKKVSVDARQVQREKADQLAWAEHPFTKEFLGKLAPKPGDERLDPDSPEGRTAAIRAGVKEQLDEFFGVIKQVGVERATALTASEAADKQADRKDQIGAYMQKHEADFTEPAILARIKELLIETTPPGGKGSTLTIERAHRLAMAEFSVAGEADVAAANTRALEHARSRVRRGGGGGVRIPVTPTFADSEEADNFYRKNPEAVQRDLAAAMKAGHLV